MPVQKNYRVEYMQLNAFPTPPTFIDITDYVYSLDELHLQSTGVITSAKITLNAEFGQFTSDATQPSTIPILHQFDLLRITIIDDAGVDQDFRILEITTNLAQYSKTAGEFLPLELEGRERNFAGIPFSGLFRSSDFKQMILNVSLSYARQNQDEILGGKQPGVILDNQAPAFNPNIWDFTHVDNCYDSIQQIISQANLPVSAGGGGNRYAAIFEDDPTFFTFIDLTVIPQGSRNSGSEPILQQNTDYPIISIDEVEQAATGTLVVARGRTGTGTQPSNFSKFIGRLEFYNNLPYYDSTITYPTGVYVRSGGSVYQSKTTVPISTPPPNVTYWNVKDVGDYIGDLQYSPFTVDKLGPLKNGWANPEGGFGTTFDNLAIPDSNLIIRDAETNRELVLIRSNTTVIEADPFLNKYMTNFGGTREFVHGTTCLVDTSLGPVAGDFVGTDRNGIAYADNIAIFLIPENNSPTNGEWVVMRETQDYDQVTVWSLGRTYEWNVAFNPVNNRIYPGSDRRRGGPVMGTKAWRDISDLFLGNECWHHPINVTQTTGLIPSTLPDGEALNDPLGNPYNQDSAIKIEFGYNQAVAAPEEHDVWFKIFKQVVTPLAGIAPFLLNLAAATFTNFTTPSYTSMGWWFSWASPYPLSTHNGISEEIGQLYGGDVNTLNRHRYFDMFNIRFTTTGKEGWTHDDSEDLSEVTGVKFLFNFDITVGGTRVPFTGDIPFTYWCMDDQGTVWKSPKKMVRHLGETQSIEIEFGDLSPIYRARTPLGIDNVLTNIIVPELEVNEVFFKDRILLQGFQCETPYDKEGRYSPNLFEQIIKPVFFDAFAGGVADVRFVGILDAFNWVKTPVAISATNSLSDERIIIPSFSDYENIINVEQLQRFADAQQQVEQFQFLQYSVKQAGVADLSLEDSVWLRNGIIEQSENGANTILMAVREIIYKVPHDAGLTRDLILVRKIT